MINCIPFIPVEQYSKTLKLLFLGNRFGLTTLVVKNMLTEQVVHIQNAGEYTFLDRVFQYPCIRIKNLEAGEYMIYAAREDGSDRSPITRIHMTGDSKSIVVKTAISHILQTENEKLLQIPDQVSDKSNVISGLHQFIEKSALSEEDDEDDTYQYARLLQAVIDIYNARIRQFQLVPYTFSIDQETKKFTMNSDTIKVIRYNLLTKEVKQVVRKQYQQEYFLQMEDNAVYAYFEIDENGNPINVHLHYSPSLPLYNRFKADRIARKEKLDKVIERIVNYPAPYLSFNDTELSYLALIDKLQPSIPALECPKVTLEKRTVYVMFNQNDWQLLEIIKDNLYLSIREPELCLNEDDERRIKVTGPWFSFPMISLSMIDEDYLVWVETEDRQIISNVSVLQLLASGPNDEKDLNDRIRKLSLYNYEQHMKPYVKSKYPDSYKKILDEYDLCKEDETVYPIHAVHHVLEKLCIGANISVMPSAIKALYEDTTLYGNYKTQFFDGSLYYKYKSNTIVLPDASNWLYILDTYSFTEGWCREYLVSQALMATEYRFEGVQYAVVRAIDLNNFKYSGFLLIDYTQPTIKARLYSFLVTTEEVNYY